MLADAVFVTDTDTHLEEISGCFDELKTENTPELGVTSSYLSDFKSPAECWNRRGFSTSQGGNCQKGHAKKLECTQNIQREKEIKCIATRIKAFDHNLTCIHNKVRWTQGTGCELKGW